MVSCDQVHSVQVFHWWPGPGGVVTVGQLYPGYSDASHWEWVSCGRVHSVQVFRSGVAQDPALLRESDGPGRLGLLLQNVRWR